MDETKKSKGLIILVIILIICVLGLGGYIVYNKVLNKPSQPNITSPSTTNKVYENSITEKIITFSDLNLIETKDYSKDYKVIISGKQSILNISNSFTNIGEEQNEGQFETVFSLNGKKVYTFTSDTFTGTSIYGIAVYNNSYIAVIEDGLYWDQLDIKHVTFVNQNDNIKLNNIFNINDSLKFENENIYYYTEDITKSFSCIPGGINIDIYKYRTSISNNKLNKPEQIGFIESKLVTCGEE